jgi:branched-chain amino acid transport system ATP-binding protein
VTALSTSELEAGYGTTKIIKGVSFEVAFGEVVCLVGRNGVGKSTLLKAIMGLIRPMAGGVEVCGRTVAGWTTHRIARLGVAYAPQERSIFAELTVADNVRLAWPAGKEDEARMEELFQLFPVLGERRRQQAGSLSGGERKMLILARALAPRSRLILLDEVAEGVQPNWVDRFVQIIEAEATKGAGLLLVEQHVNFALSLASRYLVMAGGEIVQEGRVDAQSRRAIEHHLVL